jgi:hypothetical protein
VPWDNQGIYVQDLAVAGLARARAAKSVHVGGWSTLVAFVAGEGAGLPPDGSAGQWLVHVEPAVLRV